MPPLESNNERPFVMLRQFRDLPEALVAKTILDSAGIECLLGDENMIRMDWFWSNAMGGVKLWIREESATAAATLLAEQFPGEISGEHQTSE